jgi:hypothetical protein
VSLEHATQRQSSAHSTSNGRAPDLSDRFVSRREAASYLGLTVSQLAHDVVHGRLGIPYHRFGQRATYRLSELDQWAEGCRRRGAIGTSPDNVAPPREGTRAARRSHTTDTTSSTDGADDRALRRR